MRERIKGWRRDKDDWLVRPLKRWDRTEAWFNHLHYDSQGHSYSCLGFINAGRVYVRQVEHAKAFDYMRGR